MLAKNLIWSLAAGLALASLEPTRAADVDPYLPDDTEAVLTVNVKQLLGSGLVKKYALEQMKMALSSDRAKEVLSPLGLDPLKDISSVTMAGPGGDNPDKLCLIIRGKFDAKKVRAAAEKESKKEDSKLEVVKEGEHTIYKLKNPSNRGRNPLGDTTYLGLAGNEVIVASPNKDFVVKSLDKSSTTSPKIDKKLAKILKNADASQSLFLAGLAAGLEKSELARDEKVKELLGKVEAMSIALKVSDDMKLKTEVDAKTAEAAGDLKKQLEEGVDQAKALVGVLALNNPDIVPLVDILGTAKVKSDKQSVTLDATISADAIDKLLKLLARAGRR